MSTCCLGIMTGGHLITLFLQQASPQDLQACRVNAVILAVAGASASGSSGSSTKRAEVPATGQTLYMRACGMTVAGSDAGSCWTGTASTQPTAAHAAR